MSIETLMKETDEPDVRKKASIIKISMHISAFVGLSELKPITSAKVML